MLGDGFPQRIEQDHGPRLRQSDDFPVQRAAAWRPPAAPRGPRNLPWLPDPSARRPRRAGCSRKMRPPIRRSCVPKAVPGRPAQFPAASNSRANCAATPATSGRTSAPSGSRSAAQMPMLAAMLRVFAQVFDQGLARHGCGSALPGRRRLRRRVPQLPDSARDASKFACESEPIGAYITRLGRICKDPVTCL